MTPGDQVHARQLHRGDMSDERGKEYARRQMMEWAEGRRSYTNLGPEAPYTPDVIAIMNAQEVAKWASVYRALVGGNDG